MYKRFKDKDRGKRIVASGRLFALLKEIREIEQDPQIVIDQSNRLNSVMADAVMNNAPAKALALLQSLPAQMSTWEADHIIENRPELRMNKSYPRWGCEDVKTTPTYYFI